jgi:hypothetical protein
MSAERGSEKPRPKRSVLDGEVLYEIPVRNVFRAALKRYPRSGGSRLQSCVELKQNVTPAPGGAGCKPAPAKF